MSADRVSALRGQLDVLGPALARWSARDDTRPQPEVRQAANAAVDAAGAMLRELAALRARLADEMRASDEAAAARADALLERLRGDKR